MKGKRSMKTLRKVGIGLSAAALCCCLSLTAILPSWKDETAYAGTKATSNITQINVNSVDTHIEDYFSESTTAKLSDTVSPDETISLIIRTEEESILAAYTGDVRAQSEYTVGEYALTAKGSAVSANITKSNNSLQTLLRKSGIPFTVGNTYNVLFGGFEVLAKAAYFDSICDALDGKATVIVGETYARCETVQETEIVTNTVNVYDTGIFDSSDSEYDGSGVVIAVLDTGLDYTHTAFSPERFEGDEVVTLASLSGQIGNFTASSMTPGLSAEDVYINAKIPFAYDYADNDSDVFPINSEHGTHVSGIIVGKDDEITGVAPNAQLAFMKVFSDKTSGAKTSWILAGLEDCVALGVDVINMSLGSAAGFSREVDKENVQRIYDSIAAQGISLVVAAGNDYNSTYGSEKNGNLGLTSNPDSASVGSPSTYSAALSVASISGVKTPYLTSSVSGDAPIYLTEASGTGAVTKKFVDELFAYTGTTSDTLTLEYAVIPGVGRSSDYGSGASAIDVTGKIALVRRGSTNFEDKARIAREKGAVACIIYNNVSGDISMSVGAVGAFPVCSISQDDGEMLAKVTSGGTITISTSQVSGPFMSNFSSWGPTPDLGIKPEITAHGGDIYSAVPGQSYDRLSGTSMAAPNQAGVTALIRQYVKEKFPDASVTEVTALVNQIMMSTTDIVYNKSGLAYSVRKQGSGLANLTKATTTPAYIRTYDSDGAIMDKTKLELGDDPSKSGVYTMNFEVVNVGSGAVSYDVNAIVMTEGVSDTLTNKGLTTVTEEGYTLSGASISVSATGGSVSGSTVTVGANSAATVTVKVTLSDSDKAYLDKSFANGMYVEGFVTLTAKSGTSVDLNVPYLAFYGDWTQAPLFDLDYFATNKDELDDSIDTLDKTLPDAYATRPVGGLYRDYIVYLGSYAFTQDPSATKIAADRKYIALSNQNTGDSSATAHSIYSIWAGMLRAAKSIEVTITDSTTGKVIFTQTDYNQRKSYNYSGGGIVSSSIDVDFDVSDYNLKNNSQYLVTVKGYLDYGDGGAETNLNNTFEFPFVVDFQSPILTGAEFRSEYDKDTNKYRVYADLSIYDNHYAQAAMIGYIYENEPGSEYLYSIDSFGRYLTALYSDFNSTTTISYELTDYLDQIKQSYNGNSFVVSLYDYAMNTSTYEVSIPDEIAQIVFCQNGEEINELNLSLNETFSLSDIIQVLPSESWIPSLNFETSDERVVRVVNGKIVGVSEGSAYITAISNADPDITAQLRVNVVNDGKYDKPVADSFELTGYKVNKVYYMQSSSDRDLGVDEAGASVNFATTNYALSMYPSESVTIEYKLYAYFPEDTKVQFLSSSERIATVDEEGTIVAQSEGTTSITIRVLMQSRDKDGNPVTDQNGNPVWGNTLFSKTVVVTVKNPYVTTAIYLTHYYGLGGEVTIPDDLGITEIQQYAFSNYQYIPKDENDVIDEEDPYYSKISPIGEDTITKVTIPEGVEVIGAYAFAGLTGLKEVVLPSTLTKIQMGAFYGCTSLEKVTFSSTNNLQFINNEAFYNCTSLVGFSFDSIIAIGDAAFANAGLMTVKLPKTAQSIGAQAFYGCSYLFSISIGADKVKLGSQAFAFCDYLTQISLNASVIPEGTFMGCTSLTSVTLGADVSVINQFAFSGTQVAAFTVSAGNSYYRAVNNGQYLVTQDGTLALVSPTLTSFSDSSITAIADGVFSNNENITSVSLPNVTAVGNYAFAYCNGLRTLNLGALTAIGDYAFVYTSLTALPSLSDELTSIGDFAFFGTLLRNVAIPAGVEVGNYAFAACTALSSVTIGTGATIGEYAFGAYGDYQLYQVSGNYYAAMYDYYSSLTSLTVGENVRLGAFAFMGSSSLTEATFGNGVSIGDYAFYNCASLATADLSGVVSVGDYAFAGDRWPVYSYDGTSLTYLGFADELFSSNSGKQRDLLQHTQLTEADLSSASYVGAYAFTYAPLTTVTLSDELVYLSEGAFFCNEDLTSIDLGGVVTIGSYALAGTTALTAADVSNVGAIGDSAFYTSGLEGVSLKDGAIVGANAFSYSENLTTVSNLGNATEIGASAFEGTPISGEVDLSSVVTLGGFAFAYTQITSVVLGEEIRSLGENPFAGCLLPAFTNDAAETTYSVSDSVKVIDGVLYRIADNGGLELITYPLARADRTFTVAEGTIRIGDEAFLGSGLVSVELDRSVKSIGDKAFFGCGNLTLVVFKGVAAPILEEKYDIDYLFTTDENGNLRRYSRIISNAGVELTDGTIIPTLALVPFKTWNYSGYTNYLYGGNFVDRIGESGLTQQSLIMVRPVNGTGYGTFILSQYFDLTVDGATAPTDATLAVIGMIRNLPAVINLTLNDADAVSAALAAYNLLSLDQQALVAGMYDGTNYYATLIDAKDTIDYLQSLSKTGEEENPPEEEKGSLLGLYITLGVLAGVFVIVAAVVIVLRVTGKKKAAAETSAATEETGVSETAEATEETGVSETAESATEAKEAETEQQTENGAGDDARNDSTR